MLCTECKVHDCAMYRVQSAGLCHVHCAGMCRVQSLGVSHVHNLEYTTYSVQVQEYTTNRGYSSGVHYIRV